MAYTDIDKPSDYFSTKLYTGNGSTQSITGVGFQPDWVWYKNRSATANHGLFDAVRGATKLIQSNVSGAEQTVSGVTSFDSDGFGIGSDSDGNGNGNNIVAWNWKAGSSTSTNTSGTINTTVNVNQTAGFSIATFTSAGATTCNIGHGLGVKPAFVIIKNRSDTNQWIIYHHKLNIGTSAPPENVGIALESTSAGFDYPVFQDTAPTSTLMYYGNSADVGCTSDANGENFVVYSFAEKKGYSKFGSYTGNGNADGTFVYTGFKPAFFMLKRTNGTEDWVIYDNKRDPINKAERILRPNATNAESTSFFADILSNGFKLRMASEAKVNGSGDTYIYMAFAENPFVTSTGIPTTAR